MYWHVSGQVVVGIKYFPTLWTRECFLLGLTLVRDSRGYWGLGGLGEAESREGGPHPELGHCVFPLEREHGGESEGAWSAATAAEEAGSGAGRVRARS